MEITRTSPITGVTRTLDLPITLDQYRGWQSGLLLQNAFPHLSPGEREFILTGISEDEWDEMFGGDEDE